MREGQVGQFWMAMMETTPALVGTSSGGDMILCDVTSQNHEDRAHSNINRSLDHFVRYHSAMRFCRIYEGHSDDRIHYENGLHA